MSKSTIVTYVPEITESQLNAAISGVATEELVPSRTSLISCFSEDVVSFGVALVKHVTDDNDNITIKPYHCVVMSNLPADKSIHVIEGVDSDTGKKIYYCCVTYDSNYRGVTSRKFSSDGKTFTVSKITSRGAQRYVIYTDNTVLTAVATVATSNVVTPTVAKAPEPHPVIAALIDGLCDTSGYSYFDVMARKGESESKIRITIVSPLLLSQNSRDRRDVCNRDNCIDFSCSRHTVSEKHECYKAIAEGNWAPSNMNSQLKAAAVELCKLYADYRKNRTCDNNYRFMRRALLAVVTDGKAFKIID